MNVTPQQNSRRIRPTNLRRWGGYPLLVCGVSRTGVGGALQRALQALWGGDVFMLSVGDDRYRQARENGCSSFFLPDDSTSHTRIVVGHGLSYTRALLLTIAMHESADGAVDAPTRVFPYGIQVPDFVGEALNLTYPGDTRVCRLLSMITAPSSSVTSPDVLGADIAIARAVLCIPWHSLCEILFMHLVGRIPGICAQAECFLGLFVREGPHTKVVHRFFGHSFTAVLEEGIRLAEDLKDERFANHVILKKDRAASFDKHYAVSLRGAIRALQDALDR